MRRDKPNQEAGECRPASALTPEEVDADVGTEAVQESVTAAMQSVPEERRQEAAAVIVKAATAAAVRAAPEAVRGEVSAATVPAAAAAAVEAAPEGMAPRVAAVAVRRTAEAAIHAAPDNERQEVAAAVGAEISTSGSEEARLDAVTQAVERTVESVLDRRSWPSGLDEFHGYVTISIDSARLKGDTFAVLRTGAAPINLTVTVSTTPTPPGDGLREQVNVTGAGRATEIGFVIAPDLHGALLMPLQRHVTVAASNGHADADFSTKDGLTPGKHEGFVEVLQKNRSVFVLPFWIDVRDG